MMRESGTHWTIEGVAARIDATPDRVRKVIQSHFTRDFREAVAQYGVPKKHISTIAWLIDTEPQEGR